MSTDPFSSTTGVIAPLSVNGSIDEYSIKLILKNSRTGSEQVSLFAGTFISDLTARAVGIQAAIMASLEAFIQQGILAIYSIGDLPSLGRPVGYTLQPNDILVSYSDRNDYFVFSDDGTDANIRFISLGQSDFTDSGAISGLPMSYNLVGANSQVDYTVSYNGVGNFTISDSKGDVLVFNNGVTFTFNGNTLVQDNTWPDGTVTYRQEPFTDVGVTVLPGTLPANQNDIIIAEGVSGFFYSEDSSPTVQPLIDYLLNPDNTTSPFTAAQANCIGKVCRAVFIPFKNAVSHTVNSPNFDAFSTGNGFAAYVSIGNVSLEIRIT